jgi:hypothetical protein
MTLLKLFYDWCVLTPARLIDVLVIIPLGLAPFAAAYFTWSWLVDGIKWRSRLSLYVRKFFGWAITVYIFAVTAIALIEFPHVMRWMGIHG